MSSEVKTESVNEILKKVAKESKNLEYKMEDLEENKSISIFERLLSCRICDNLSF